MNAADDALLRRAYRANAAFSLLSGSVMLLADGLVSAILQAYDQLAAIHVVGVGLLAFGVLLLWLASRETLAPGPAVAVILADLVWVLGSWLAIGAGLATGQGAWAVGIVADVVLIFAIVQAIGWRRLQRGARRAAA